MMPATGSATPLFKRFSAIAPCWRVAVRPYPREAMTLLLFMWGSAMMEMMTVGLTVPLLDVLTGPERAEHGPVVAIAARALQAMGITPALNMVIVVLIGVASVLFLIRGALFLLTQYCTAAVAIKLRWGMKSSLLEKFLNAQYEPVSKRARGTVISDINVPAEALANVIVNLGMFFAGMLSSALMIGLLLYLSWWATVFIALFAIGGVQGWRWYTDHRSAAYGRTLSGLRRAQNKLQVDAIDGLKVVKAHGLERRMVERQDALLAAELRPELQLVFFKNAPYLVNELIAVVIVIGLGAVTFLAPSLGIRFSVLTAFLLAIRRITPAMTSINQASISLSSSQRNLELIEEVLTLIPQEKRGGRLVERVEEIHLNHVSFWYAARPEHQVLQMVEATMRRGMVTALVGPTGSGKSTIANLVVGLYTPQSGDVRINGVDLRSLDPLAWRKKLGYVSQDIFVFNDTIRDNIALGDDRVPSSEIEWAARIAQLHEFVASLPEGYETVVGDRGLRLSGGQCQRLAIARAILRRPEVLIFDEATSALDNLTERAVYDAISALHREAIVIIIAHRLSTVREADQIVVLEAGRVVGVGTHDVLMHQHALYAKLYEEDGQSATSRHEAAELKVTE